MNEPNKDIKYIDDPKEIPEGLSDEEQIAFWETHGLSEDFLQKTEEIPEDERPRPRTKPINVRFDDFTLGRLKALAGSRNVGYQTLLKAFVQERLYEEERRQGIFVAVEAPAVATEKPKEHRRQDWLNRVHDYLKEHRELLEDSELDSITNSRLASQSASMLKEISGEIRENSRRKDFPANILRRKVKAYEALKPFVKEVIGLYEERFGTEELGPGQPESSYDAVKEAERILQES